jgi:hypothetical protein
MFSYPKFICHPTIRRYIVWLASASLNNTLPNKKKQTIQDLSQDGAVYVEEKLRKGHTIN